MLFAERADIRRHASPLSSAMLRHADVTNTLREQPCHAIYDGCVDAIKVVERQEIAAALGTIWLAARSTINAAGRAIEALSLRLYDYYASAETTISSILSYAIYYYYAPYGFQAILYVQRLPHERNGQTSFHAYFVSQSYSCATHSSKSWLHISAPFLRQLHRSAEARCHEAPVAYRARYFLGPTYT